MSEEKQDNQKAPEEIAVPDKFRTADGSVNTDALLKSYTDLEKNRSQVVTEIDHLKKELEATKANASIAEGIKKIVENTSPKEAPAQSYDEYISDLTAKAAEELGLEPDDPAVKLTVKVASEQAKALSTWNKDDIKQVEERYEARLAELKTLIDSDKSERVKTSAEYLANKAQIEELVGAGMAEDNAIKFVLSKAATTSDISTPPPGTPMGRIAGAKAPSEYWASGEERELFVRKYGEEATLKAEQAGLQRIARNGVA